MLRRGYSRFLILINDESLEHEWRTRELILLKFLRVENDTIIFITDLVSRVPVNYSETPISPVRAWE